MAEYIEREALLQDIEDSVCFSAKTGTISAEMRGTNKIIDRIKCAPAADVEPVRHGRWIEYEDEYCGLFLKCSICGEEFVSWEADCARTNYCPNCGAKMDEEVAE